MNKGVKQHVLPGKEVHFEFLRDGIMYYRTDEGLLFEVPISEAGTASFNRDEKALLFMRWIRKQLDANEQGMAECQS